ncbi:hypothetical protein [Bacterioplanoides sp.]|uniref:phage nozzle protein n=1 Tax=Bacterioplanoides sp. TaxID=2066072 RepID=UPI003B003878
MQVTKALPNLINGVSQQPDLTRLDSQCEAQINCLNSVVHGMRKRPALESIRRISSPDTPMFSHTIKDSADTTYILTVSNKGSLKAQVHDQNGREHPLSMSTDAQQYLNASDITRLRAATVADYTFLVNPQKEVRTSGETTKAINRHQALVYVKRGDYLMDYGVQIALKHPDGRTLRWEFKYTTSSNEHAANRYSIQTDNIAENLSFGKNARELVTNEKFSSYGGIRLLGSVLLVESVYPFTASTTDGNGNQNLFVFKDIVTDIKDLPKEAFDGLQFKVTSAENTDEDDYYIEYGPDADRPQGSSFWKETAAPGTRFKFDPNTMPVALVRTDRGFVLSTLNGEKYSSHTFPKWDYREAGDDDTNPFPSFVGDTINDVFFYKNRLGFLSGENVVMSESGEFFNFFLNTVQTLVDSAPIDIAASHNQYTRLEATVPLGDRLLVFSPLAQFILGSDGPMTPSSVSMDVSTVFENTPRARPVSSGTSVFFGFDSSAWAGIREYFVDGDTQLNNSEDITSHVPNYLVGNITDIAVCQQERLMVVLTDGYSGAYVYNYYWEANQKVQSAWSTWETNGKFTSAHVDSSTLYFTVERSDGIHIERMELSKDSAEAHMTGEAAVHLDRRVYVPNTKTALPSLTSRTVGVSLDGRVISNIQAAHTQGIPMYIGEPFTMSYLFSRQTVRDQNGRPQVEQRAQMRRMLLNYNKTGGFSFKVTPDFRPTKTIDFTPRVLGKGSNILNRAVIDTGTFTGFVLAKSDGVAIEIESDTWVPVTIQTAEWDGVLTRKRVRV